MTYVMAMKSGARFTFSLTLKLGVSFEKYMKELLELSNNQAANNFMVDGGFVVNVNDISAIYPMVSSFNDQKSSQS